MMTVRVALILIAVLAAACAIAMPLVLRRARTLTGFDSGRGLRILASDVGVGSAMTIRDPRHGLVGRPDYVLESEEADGRRLVPLELKPRRRSSRLYDSDRLQLGVYLVALRGAFGARAAGFGYVRYTDRQFRVELTPSLEKEVLAVADRIRAARTSPVVHRSHASAARCRACSVRDHCDESLAD
jgi:CRISPR/Cas system-associated exonuclease Cas4 (RecB family)